MSEDNDLALRSRLTQAFISFAGTIVGVNGIEANRMYMTDVRFKHQVDLLVAVAVSAIKDEPVEEAEQIDGDETVEKMNKWFDTEAFWAGFRGE